MFVGGYGGEDGRLGREEFMEAVNETLFMLVLEDALKSGNPKKYFEQVARSTNSVEKALFPKVNTTIGEKEVKGIIKFFDTNGDQQVSRREIRAKFIQYRGALAKPYEQELKKVFRKLDLLTYRPQTIADSRFEYYYSSRD